MNIMIGVHLSKLSPESIPMSLAEIQKISMDTIGALGTSTK